MPNPILINIAVEGVLDEAVLRKILRTLGMEVANVYGMRGKEYLHSNIRGYNAAANYSYWVVLVDLNHSAPCPPPLVNSWVPQKNTNFQLRVAVRAIESWLMADRSSLSAFLNVPLGKIPQVPEAEDNPKSTLIQIAKSSRDRLVVKDLVPSKDSTARQGPGYNMRMKEFIKQHWNIDKAMESSPSLKRNFCSLKRWRDCLLKKQ